MREWMGNLGFRLWLWSSGAMRNKIVYARGMDYMGYDDPESAHYHDPRVRFPVEWFEEGGVFDRLLKLDHVIDKLERTTAALERVLDQSAKKSP